MFHRICDIVLVPIVGGNLKDGFVVSTAQFSRNEQHLGSQILPCPTLSRGGKTETLEPVDKVVGKEKQMKISLIGRKVASRNFRQWIVRLQFLDDEFHSRSEVIKSPDIQRFHLKVGHKHLIAVAPHRKKRQLLGWFLRNRTANDDKTVWLRPPCGLIEKLVLLEAASINLIGQRRKLCFNRSADTGHDHKVRLARLQKLDSFVIEEALISSDNNNLDRLRKLGKCLFQKLYDAGAGMRVSCSEFSLPLVFRQAVKTKKGMITLSPLFHRVITDRSQLLASVQRQHRRIQIENHAPGRLRLCAHRPQEAIMKSPEAGKRLRRHAQQQSPQSRRVRIGRKSGQILEDTVMLQQLSHLDPAQAKDHWINQRQHLFGNAIAVVPLRETDRMRNQMSGIYFLEETSQKKETGEVSECFSAKRNLKVFGAVFHLFQKPHQKLGF